MVTCSEGCDWIWLIAYQRNLSLFLFLANNANRQFNIDVFIRGVSCLDLITQSTPPVSINECVLCLHLLAEDSKTVLGHADKTCSSAATDSWELSFCSLFLYLDLDFGNRNGNRLKGATEWFCDWSKKRIEERVSPVLNAVWWIYLRNAYEIKIEDLKTTRQIYTDSSVMIVTPCGTLRR